MRYEIWDSRTGETLATGEGDTGQAVAHCRRVWDENAGARSVMVGKPRAEHVRNTRWSFAQFSAR